MYLDDEERTMRLHKYKQIFEQSHNPLTLGARFGFESFGKYQELVLPAGNTEYDSGVKTKVPPSSIPFGST
jgi:hypothetical protein